jgi:hypothetical protein
MKKKSKSKTELFLELARPDEEGFSRCVSSDEFVGEYSRLSLGNGGDWCRSDGSLGRKFNIERIKEKGKIISVRLHGWRKNPVNRVINSIIRKSIEKKRCAILDIGNVEVDHKDGRLDDHRIFNPETQKLEDFQPLSKAANNAKRQHCKKCRETGKRFDARVLGYVKAVVQGDGEYRGTCVGCYWFDPKAFNRKISEEI